MRAIVSISCVLAGVVVLGGCTLDFDRLEHGRADAGALDAVVSDGGPHGEAGVDAGRDAASDARPTSDAERDATASDAWSGDDAYVTNDAFASDVGHDAFMGCPATPDCHLAVCEGASCDDGLACTSGDRCHAGACVGAPVTCAAVECQTIACTEPAGCHAIAAANDGSTCSGGGRCCYGHCSGLSDSGNCGGCGLGCDEETCTSAAPLVCICDTNAGCPSGQTCASGRCVCTSAAQCASGQTCSGGRCIY